jgi:hypothetical protein
MRDSQSLAQVLTSPETGWMLMAVIEQREINSAAYFSSLLS